MDSLTLTILFSESVECDRNFQVFDMFSSVPTLGTKSSASHARDEPRFAFSPEDGTLTVMGARRTA